MRCPPWLIFPFSISPTPVLFVLLLQGWVRALSLRRSTPSSLHLSASSQAVLFLKTQVSTITALFSRQVALCLNLSCVVSILPFEEPRRAKRSFVAFCALHLHHRTTNSCCLKACLLVYSCHRNLKRKTEDDVRLRYFSKLCVSSFMQRENLGIEVVAQPLLNSRFSLLFMFSNFLALSVVPWPLKHAEWELNCVPHHRIGEVNACKSKSLWTHVIDKVKEIKVSNYTTGSE